MQWLSRTVLLLSCAAAGLAQEMPSSHPEVTRHLIGEARRITATDTREVASRESWEPLRARRLDELRDSLGLLPWPPKTPLNPQVTRVLDKGDYIVEMVAFESLPKV
jgi:hypothetical protein